MIEFNINHFTTLASTNETAGEFIRRFINGFINNNLPNIGTLEGTVIVADRQTKGKGQFGRVWHSEVGNLYFSLMLCPPKDKQKILPGLSLLVAAAIKDVLENMLLKPGVSFVIKHPNDILANGKKISGILIEVINEVAVVGIGVNICHNPENIDQPTAKLNDLTLNATTPNTILYELLPAIWQKYQAWLQV